MRIIGCGDGVEEDLDLSELWPFVPRVGDVVLLDDITNERFEVDEVVIDLGGEEHEHHIWIGMRHKSDV